MNRSFHRAPILAALGLVWGSGCTLTPPPSTTTESIYPQGLPRLQIERYLRFDPAVLVDQDRRWVVAPQAIIEFTGDFMTFEYSVDEGVSGTILHVAQDRRQLWIGTTEAVVTLDKDLHLTRTHLQDRRLWSVFVGSVREDEAVAVTDRGLALIDSRALTQEIFPLPSFSIRDVFDVELVNDEVWVATRRGLHRFSIEWKNWDQRYRTKKLREASVLRLEKEPVFLGDRVIGERLYAITAEEVFAYEPTFDSWERLGL